MKFVVFGVCGETVRRRVTTRRQTGVEFVIANRCFAEPLGRSESGSGGPVQPFVPNPQRLGRLVAGLGDPVWGLLLWTGYQTL